MRPVPIKSKVPVSYISAQGYIVAEGRAKSIGSLELQHEDLSPLKAAAVLVVSSDLVKLGGPLASALIDAELRKGVAQATDDKFTTDLVAATTPTASSGDFLYDLETLLSAIDGDASSKYFVVVEPDNAKRLGVMASLVTSGRAYPELTVNGGTIGGVTVVVSDQLSSGQVVAFDATQIAADPGVVRLDASENATLDMTGGNAPDLSLWQKNLRALRAERFFGYSILRPTAVASLTGATYTAGSPA